MSPRAKRAICWPVPTFLCLRGECGYCYAGRMIAADTIRRYAKKNGLLSAFVFGTRNPKVEWRE